MKLQDLFWAQNIEFATRFRSGQNPSQLDLVFTNQEYAIDQVEAKAPLGKSDHLILIWDYQFQSDCYSTMQLPESVLKRNFNKGRYDAMNNELQGVDWALRDDMNVDEMWSTVKDVLDASIEKHVPPLKRKKNQCKSAPWWTKKLTKEVKNKQALWKKYSQLRSPSCYQHYAVQRNKVTNLIREARREYEEYIAKQGKQDPHRIHRYIRSQLKIKPQVGALERKTGELTERDCETAQVLNVFFQSVFVEENTNDIPEFLDIIGEDLALKDIDISESEVQEQLRSLTEGKAAGPDGIPAILLKRCFETLTKPLTRLFKRSLQLGKLPSHWKIANITPIFKKGSKVKAENYRPMQDTREIDT